LPTKFHGVILANEVLDALPVHLFHYQNQNLFERRVASQDGNFIWRDEPLTDPLLLNAVEQLNLPQTSKQEYLSEINPTLPSFVHALLDAMTLGQIILIDYGFLRDTYYHPDRTMGTLMCHYRHHAHPDPFFYPGLQDITAHVDFTTVGRTAQEAGAEVALYSQAEYLLENGILRNFEFVTEQMDDLQRLRLSKALQTLIQPHEMGELFKVMVINK
jgi:SAM-dependent MidA family methyltransferase